MSATREKAQLMSASEIDRTLVRLAHEILEKSADLDQLAFIGIRRRGVPLAQRLSRKIEALESRKVPVGILDINLYRDDLSTVDIKPVVSATDIQFEVGGKDIILMDDVLYTGRTIRAALDALFDHGRPARPAPAACSIPAPPAPFRCPSSSTPGIANWPSKPSSSDAPCRPPISK